MISKWLAYDTQASWNKLARALEESGMRVVAKEILGKYVPGYRGRFACNQYVLLQKVQVKECCKLANHSCMHNYIMARATSNTALAIV